MHGEAAALPRAATSPPFERSERACDPNVIPAQVFLQYPPLRYCNTSLAAAGSADDHDERRGDTVLEEPDKKPAETPPVSNKTYVDEAGEDLVVIGGGEAYFSSFAISRESALREGTADVLHVKTRADILCARRNPFVLAQGMRLVAVSHDDRSVNIYGCATNPTAPSPHTPTQSTPNEAEGAQIFTPVADPCANWLCQPMSFRFGSGKYIIRAFYWLPPSQSVPVCAHLLVLSEIALDLVSVTPQPLASDPAAPPTTLIKRITTRVDYFRYNASASVAVCVNRTKPNILKSFLFERTPTYAMRVLPQVRVDDGRPLAYSPDSASQMQVPVFCLQVLPMVLYGDRYLAHLSAANQLTLYRLATDLGAYTKCYVFELADGPRVNIQTLDNLVLVSGVDCTNVSIFDIRVGPSPPNLAALAKTTSPSSTSPNRRAGAVSDSSPQLQTSGEGSAGSFTSSFRSWREKLGSFGGAGGEDVRCKMCPTFPPSPLCAQSSSVLRQSNDGVPVSAKRLQQLCFYNAAFPVVLDRATGTVWLVSLCPSHVVSPQHEASQSVQFLLNRSGCGGQAIPRILFSLIANFEPLPVLGHLFDLICERHGSREKTGSSQGPTPPAATDNEAVASSSQTKMNFSAQQSSARLGSASPSASRPFRCAAPHQRLTVSGSVRALQAMFPDMGFLSQITTPPPPSASGPAVAEAAAAYPILSFEEASRNFRGPHEEVNETRTADSPSGPPPPSLTSRRIDQHVMYRYVFCPLMERVNDRRLAGTLPDEMCSRPAVATAASSQKPPQLRNLGDDESGEPVNFPAKYLLYSLLEYTRSLIKHQQRISDVMQRIFVDMFINGPEPDYYRLHQLLMYRVIDDHVSVALQLLGLEKKYPPAFQMALDMLFRLNAHTQIVNVFIVKRMPLRAARYILVNGIAQSPVAEVLQCAVEVEEETGDRSIFPVVYQMIVKHLTVNKVATPVALEPFARRFKDRCEAVGN